MAIDNFKIFLQVFKVVIAIYLANTLKSIKKHGPNNTVVFVLKFCVSTGTIIVSEFLW